MFKHKFFRIFFLFFLFLTPLSLAEEEGEGSIDESDFSDLSEEPETEDSAYGSELEEDFNSEEAPKNIKAEHFQVVEEDEEESPELASRAEDIKGSVEDYEVIDTSASIEQELAPSDSDLEQEFAEEETKTEEEETPQETLVEDNPEEESETLVETEEEEQGEEVAEASPEETYPEEEESGENLVESQNEIGSPEVTTPTVVASEESSEDEKNIIKNIRYVAEDDQIIIDSTKTISYIERKNEGNNQYIIEILEAKIDKKLKWPYVLRDFKTQFGIIKADQKDESTVRIVVQLKDKSSFPHSVILAEGTQLVIGYGKMKDGMMASEGEESHTLTDVTLEDLYKGDFEFTGSPISFHVNKADVTQVLRFLSEENNLNMVIGEKVTGNVTLKLEDVPWDQALHTILKVKSLGYTKNGNVITILPLTEIEAHTNKVRQITAKQRSLQNFETKVIPVSYAQLKDIETHVKELSTKSVSGGSGGEGSSGGSTAGKIITDEKSGVLIVIDTPRVIKKIEKLVKVLDKAPRQVMVEAKVVEVAKSFTRSFGLDWDLTGNFPVYINASNVLQLLSNIGGNYRVDSKSGSPGNMSFNLSGIPILGDLNATLSLAEEEGEAKVISAPKVVTVSGKEATIVRDAPIQILSAVRDSEATDVRTQEYQTVSVQLQLKVKPTVTPTGSVFLEVDVTKSDPSSASGGTTISRNAKTELLAKNGQTVVIGGIYEENEVLQESGPIWLRKIPILNLLFGRWNTSQAQTELLVFITPKVLDGIQ